MLDNTESHYLSGLIVVEVTLNGFANSHTTVISSGSSSNYDRRRCLEGSQPYAEAMKAQDSITITVRLSTRACVTSPKISKNLVVEFLDLYCVKRCLVIALYTRYDLILRILFQTRHKTWID